jgi:hypothetical protein
MTLPLRQEFQEKRTEGVLVTRTTQEGEVWRAIVWDGESIKAAAVRWPGAEVHWESVTRSELNRVLEDFEQEGVPEEGDAPVLATDGEIWGVVTKRSGADAVWISLVCPELRGGKSRKLSEIAQRVLFGASGSGQ